MKLKYLTCCVKGDGVLQEQGEGTGGPIREGIYVDKKNRFFISSLNGSLFLTDYIRFYSPENYVSTSKPKNIYFSFK